MGAEALGRWLSEELGGNQQQIRQLLAVIDQLQQQQLTDHQLTGKEFTLRLNKDEVEVFANHIVNQDSEELAEDLHHYDDELHCGCGLADFQDILLSWQQFIQDN